ncbi:MAG: hypothetical protein LBU12_02935 [Deltaproteobacteria bacterium]|nr:hypothetical protein [Deltaproteobacteria bacterium]
MDLKRDGRAERAVLGFDEPEKFFGRRFSKNLRVRRLAGEITRRASFPTLTGQKGLFPDGRLKDETFFAAASRLDN